MVAVTVCGQALFCCNINLQMVCEYGVIYISTTYGMYRQANMLPLIKTSHLLIFLFKIWQIFRVDIWIIKMQQTKPGMLLEKYVSVYIQVNTQTTVQYLLLKRVFIICRGAPVISVEHHLTSAVNTSDTVEPAVLFSGHLNIWVWSIFLTVH